MGESSKFELAVIIFGLLMAIAGWFFSTLLLIIGVVITLAGLFLFFGGYFTV